MYLRATEHACPQAVSKWLQDGVSSLSPKDSSVAHLFYAAETLLLHVEGERPLLFCKNRPGRPIAKRGAATHLIALEWPSSETQLCPPCVSSHSCVIFSVHGEGRSLPLHYCA